MFMQFVFDFRKMLLDIIDYIYVFVMVWPQVATAVLSITAKARAKAKKAEEGKSNEAMDTVCSLFDLGRKQVNMMLQDQDAGNSDAVEEAVDKVEEKEKDKEIGEEKEKEPEPLFEMLANPARVIPVQVYVSLFWSFVLLWLFAWVMLWACVCIVIGGFSVS